MALAGEQAGHQEAEARSVQSREGLGRPSKRCFQVSGWSEKLGRRARDLADTLWPGPRDPPGHGRRFGPSGSPRRPAHTSGSVSVWFSSSGTPPAGKPLPRPLHRFAPAAQRRVPCAPRVLAPLHAGGGRWLRTWPSWPCGNTIAPHVSVQVAVPSPFSPAPGTACPALISSAAGPEPIPEEQGSGHPWLASSDLNAPLS